jgi:RNA polymerase sigma-70 factor (ECF subfamily)
VTATYETLVEDAPYLGESEQLLIAENTEHLGSAATGALVLVVETTPPDPAEDMAKLVVAAQAGDGGAFARLVDATADHARGLAMQLCGNPHDAEDVVQDSFMRAFRGLEGFRREAKFNVWLYRIVANSAINYILKRDRQLPAEPNDTWFDDRTETRVVGSATKSGEPDINSLVLREDLRAALRRLPKKQRNAVVLFDVIGYTHEEIAKDFGQRNSKVDLHRGRKKLREILYPLPGDK